MEQYVTLQRSWDGIAQGYPIRVEEHRYDLTYIVEFYDGHESGDGQCLTHCPHTGELLTMTMLREGAVVAG